MMLLQVLNVLRCEHIDYFGELQLYSVTIISTVDVTKAFDEVRAQYFPDIL
jgi:hypothetical protein